MIFIRPAKTNLFLSERRVREEVFFKNTPFFLHWEDDKLRENDLFSAIFSLISRKKREMTADKHDYKT